MKRLTAILFAIFALSLTPTLAAGWDIQAAVNAAYVAQVTTDPAGKDRTEFVVAGLTGIQFWREPASGKIGYGFSLEVAGLPDEEQTTPRIAPGVAFHVGKKGMQGFVGALFDGQDENGVVGMFGITAAF